LAPVPIPGEDFTIPGPSGGGSTTPAPSPNGAGVSGPVNQEIEQAYINAKKKQYEYLIAKMDVTIAAYRTARLALDIILGLVVLVVVSGLCFSGFQLWKSISVAGVQPTSEMELSASKVRITSSVVGVVVLLISLAFLFIYATMIYGVAVVGQPTVQQTKSTDKG